MHCRRMEYRDIQASTWPKGVFSTPAGSASRGEAVVVLACIEKGDSEEYVRQAAARVDALNRQFHKQKTVFVMPFAHLSSRLEHANRAVPLLSRFVRLLGEKGYNATLGTFGTDKDFLIDIIGHRASVSYFEFPFDGKPGVKPAPAPDFSWNPELYRALNYSYRDKMFRMLHSDEMGLLSSIAGMGKTLVELGAGYGRAIDESSMRYGKTIAIELDSAMHQYLSQKYSGRKDIKVIKGDATKLRELTPKAERPVVTILQNSLGTWAGDWRKALREAIAFAKENSGEVVLSLFMRESLPTWGLSLYNYFAPLVGEYDAENSRLERGDFATKAGYHNHWWGRGERRAIKKLFSGAKVSIKSTEQYWILHADYSQPV